MLGTVKLHSVESADLCNTPSEGQTIMKSCSLCSLYLQDLKDRLHLLLSLQVSSIRQWNQMKKRATNPHGRHKRRTLLPLNTREIQQYSSLQIKIYLPAKGLIFHEWKLFYTLFYVLLCYVKKQVSKESNHTNIFKNLQCFPHNT